MDMTDAFNRHEPDASLVHQRRRLRKRERDLAEGGPPKSNRAGKSGFETVLKEARIKPLAIRIRFIRPDVAIAHVHE